MKVTVTKIRDTVNLPKGFEQSAFVARTAERVLREQQAKNRFPKVGYVRFVDGKVSKSPKNVYPFGNIEYLRNSDLGTVALYALTVLEDLSPIGRGYEADRSGRYHLNHVIIYNGRIMRDVFALNQAMKQSADPANDSITIANVQPYARKIERGQSTQALSGVYKVAGSRVRRRFGKIAFINLTWIMQGSVPGLRHEMTYRAKRNGSGSTATPSVLPSIRIRRGRGTGAN